MRHDQLNDLPGAEAFPDWSPDETRIAFVASREGNCEIYVLQADGSGLTNLTDSQAVGPCPSSTGGASRQLQRGHRTGR